MFPVVQFGEGGVNTSRRSYIYTCIYNFPPGFLLYNLGKNDACPVILILLVDLTYNFLSSFLLYNLGNKGCMSSHFNVFVDLYIYIYIIFHQIETPTKVFKIQT